LTSNEIGCGGFSVQIIIKGGRRRHAIVGGVIQKKRGDAGEKMVGIGRVFMWSREFRFIKIRKSPKKP
jgi:hypothetical protein